MKTKYLFLALLVGSLVLCSCKKEEEGIKNETQTTAIEATSAKPQITTTPVQAAPTGERPALNPAHGQPYHRCEIAVGAPLDGPATQQGNSPIQNSPGPKSFFKTVQSENATTAATPVPTPQPTPQATTTVTPSAKPSAPAATTANTPKPKNNPAHGQPHHRCDIAVGAPLPDA